MNLSIQSIWHFSAIAAFSAAAWGTLLGKYVTIDIGSLL